MAYSKTSWVARVGTALNRFLKSNETDESVELTADPTGVSTPGTPFSADNMNKIEQGIYDAHEAMGGNFSELDTDGEPAFAKLTLTTSTYGSKDIAPRSSWVVPAGIYQTVSSTSLHVMVYRDSESEWIMSESGPCAIISDGSNVGVWNNSSKVTYTICYRKFS